MFQTSKAYKESMNQPIRNESYMKVRLGLINQEAQSSAVLQSREKYNAFSDADSIFSQHTVKRYATYEKESFRADGSLYFLPRLENEYWKDGITSTDLFNDSFQIKFVFGYGKSDIKGLSIQFSENYPTIFSIITDDGTSVSFENEVPFFNTDTVFSNTESIAIQITEMRVPDVRVRIDYIQFGLGLEYDNDWITEANSKTNLSVINEELPESEFSVTLNNENQIFNVDNPASEINFLESGQKINVEIGYKLDDGNIEWMKLHSLYVYEWSADDSKATIKAVDILKFLEDNFYKGIYYESGITLYDLAKFVCQDAGLSSDEYYIDTYLKKITVYNPLPNVTHKEALQIIANAGRCIMDHDRSGKIRIRAAFTPTYTTTSNGTTSYSNVSNIDSNYSKNQYATYEGNYWMADGEMLFAPHTSTQDSGYVSSVVSDSEGKFSTNPIITRTLESKYKAYGIMMIFPCNLPKQFIIRTYADNVLNDTITISSMIEKEFELQYDFKEFDKMEIEFIETSNPNSRIHVDYISLGEETNYKIEYDDLYSTPVGTQLEKIKNVKVARYIYSQSNSEEELITEKIAYDGNNQTYFMTDACYGYRAIINDATSGQSVSIVESGSYYVEVSFSGVSSGDEISIIIYGYKYNVSTAYSLKAVNNRGSDKEWQNPLISDLSHCNSVAAWLADYFASGIEYELSYRGEPAIDVGDVIGQENKYDSNLKTIVEESQLKFDGAISGALITRRKESVDRT